MEYANPAAKIVSTMIEIMTMIRAMPRSERLNE
jgi:hypothetical protein